MFAVVLMHEWECWEIVLHWSLPRTCFRGFTRIGPAKISLFVPVILCSRFANRAFLSTSFMDLKFKIAVLGIPGMHATRWLDGVLIVFLKRLADFMKKIKLCTIPTWTRFSFLHRNSKLVILTKHPKSCIGHL